MTIAASRLEAVGATAEKGIALPIWETHPLRMHDTAARGAQGRMKPQNQRFSRARWRRV